MKNWRLWGCLLLWCFALAGWCAADAAYAAEKKSPAVENADFASLTKELNGIEEVLKSGKVDNAAISRYVSFLGDLRSRLLETQNRLNSGLKSINRRIESLGEAPKEGEEELPVIAEKRKEYNEEAVFQKGRIAENDLLINRVDELTALIVIVRNKVLFGNLFVYQDPLIYPSNLLKATGQFLDFCFNIIKSPVDWYRDLTAEQKNTVDSNVFTVILAIGATLAVGYMLRRLIIRHLGYKQNLTAVFYQSDGRLFRGLCIRGYSGSAARQFSGLGHSYQNSDYRLFRHCPFQRVVLRALHFSGQCGGARGFCPV